MILSELRFCTEDDIEQVLLVNGTSPDPWTEALIRNDLYGTALSYLGAFATSELHLLLGYAVLGAEHGSALLMNLVVVPAYRRMCIGSQLVLGAAECALAMNFKNMILRVRASNMSARSLYRSLGFLEDFSQKKRSYSDGEPAVCMFARLPLKIE